MWTNGQIPVTEHPMRVRPKSGSVCVSAPQRGLSEAMICWATWSPRPGRELEAKPALANSLKGQRMRFTKKSRTIMAGAAIVGLASAGVAYAYWTNTGSGTGTATTGTNLAVTVNQTSTVVGMYPGQLAQTLAGDFTNPNPGATWVAAVTATSYSIDAAHVTAGCTVAGGNYTLGGTALVGQDVAAGANHGSWTGLTIAMNDLPGTNQDACKGAIVTITYASS